MKREPQMAGPMLGPVPACVPTGTEKGGLGFT